MHDPMTVAHEIKSPFRTYYGPNKEHVTRNTLVTIWHVDPEKDGTDDSCGWFPRARHGDEEVVKKIAADFAFEWHRSSPYERFGWFDPSTGMPNYSSHALVLAMFRIAANNYFGHWSKRAKRFLNAHLFDILFFAENSCDSLDDSIQQKHGRRDGDHKKQARNFASVIYAWILRAERPWWKHPKWHVHHWRIQIPALQLLRRFLFTRCSHCGGRFRRGEPVIGQGWDRPRRRWFESFRSEPDCYHENCSRLSRIMAEQGASQ